MNDRFSRGDFVTLQKIPKARPIDILIVDGIDGRDVLCHPDGGGFQARVPAVDLRMATEEEKSPAFYESFFTGDWLLADNRYRFFRGITDGRTWNGWAEPYFAKGEALRLFDVLSKDTNTANPRVEYDAAADEFVQIMDGERYPEGTIVREGTRYYRIGAGWCWDEFNHSSADDRAAVSGQFPGALHF